MYISGLTSLHMYRPRLTSGSSVQTTSYMYLSNCHTVLELMS